jgi:polar amino acid transport system ATP-binding protein
MVLAEQVHKAFGHLEVLKGIDLQVAEREVMCIIGPSGSGKSTFLRCINHLEKIDAGRLSVAGNLVGYRESGGKLHELRDREVAERRRDIGMVFQRFNLFPHMTALENVTEAPIQVRGVAKAAARERGRNLLERVGLGDKANAYPNQLSGGQQQRVAIARALAMEPKLMLFDEPTSALDPELVGDVLDAMRQLARDGMTMIVVTHEIGFAREVGDTAVFIDDGVIVETGAPKEVFANPRNARTREFLSKVL